MIERQRPTRFWLVAALSSALALALVPSATPKTLVPRHPTTFFGVSDRGSVAEFKEFAGFVEKHPAVLQTFHPWGNSIKQALPRWQAVNVRPMLHISTQDDETLEELITPKAIARGRGDNYLLRLNRVLARNDIRIYLRPLGDTVYITPPLNIADDDLEELLAVAESSVREALHVPIKS